MSPDAREILEYLRSREIMARTQPREPGHEACNLALERELRLVRAALRRKGYSLGRGGSR